MLLFTVQKSPIAWAVLDGIVLNFGHDNIRNNALSKSCAQALRAGAWNYLVVFCDDDPSWSRHLRRVSPRFKLIAQEPAYRHERIMLLGGVPETVEGSDQDKAREGPLTGYPDGDARPKASPDNYDVWMLGMHSVK